MAEYIADLIQKHGFIKTSIDPELDIVSETIRLKNEKNAVILAHYYQEASVQDIADFVGDSLQLSQVAASTNADIIVFAGVNFMAETAKILSPQKKVLLPDLNAGCSLAESIPSETFRMFRDSNPDHIVVSYVNTSAAIKALSDVVCTSSNAIEIVESFPRDQKIIFTPDRNLGDYINKITGRKMLIWNGACHVHEQFSLEKILELKKKFPDAKLLTHPECQGPLRIISDFIGSTAQLLKYSQEDTCNTYIVATESGILYQMKKKSPGKNFIPAPPLDSTCGCNDCNFMKLITVEKIYQTLLHEAPEICLDKDIIDRASAPIRKMLEISAKKNPT